MGLLCNLVSDDTTPHNTAATTNYFPTLGLHYIISWRVLFFLCAVYVLFFCYRMMMTLYESTRREIYKSNYPRLVLLFSFFSYGEMGRKEMCTCSLLSTSFTIFEKWSGKGQLLGCVYFLHIRCWWPRTVFSSFFSCLMDPFGAVGLILFFGVLPQKPQLRGITRAAMKLSITGVEIVMRAVF